MSVLALYAGEPVDADVVLRDGRKGRDPVFAYTDRLPDGRGAPLLAQARQEERADETDRRRCGGQR